MSTTERWAFASIVDAIPFLDADGYRALVLQFLLFEVLVLCLGLYYQLYQGVLFGSVTVIIATGGSSLMLSINNRLNAAQVPEEYKHVFFGAEFDVVLGVVGTSALLTYVLVYDPQDNIVLVTQLFGENPPAIPVFLGLILVWDICYRIGTAWWAAVATLWLTVTHDTSPFRSSLAATEHRILAFSSIQLLLVPLLGQHIILQVAVVGHVVAVVCAVALSRAFR